MQVFVVGSFVVACSVKVARLPRAGESLDAAAFVSEPGGKGFNVALACSRLGAQVSGVFAIGDDAFGAVAVSAFEQSGLSQDMLLKFSGSTGAGVGFVDQTGENCLAVSLGANRLLSKSSVELFSPGIQRSKIVVATFESPDEAIGTAFNLAHAEGIQTLLNPSPSRPISEDILAKTSMLVLNRIEAEDFGITVLEDEIVGGDALLDAGPELVVVTLGEGGAVALRKGQPPIRQNAFAVNAIDTIGAGDAFSSGLIVSLLEGRGVQEALRRATACGALTTCRFGAFDAFPGNEDIERFLERS